MIDFTKIEEVKPDLLLNYLTKLFQDARFDEWLEDGQLYCPDSNACVDPQEVAKYLRDNWSTLNA